MYDVIITGGGASGLAAAVAAARAGARVLVLERMDRVGKKLLATGNGRCNLANTGAPVYYGHAGFARAVLEAMSAQRVLAFFQGVGLQTREEAQGRVYPACGQAAAVLDTLRLALARLGVTVRTGEACAAVERAGEGFRVRTALAAYAARRVIVAGGGRAQPRLGSDGSACHILAALGHTIIPQRPALTPLLVAPAPIRGFAGIRLPARLTLQTEAGCLQTQGEALFSEGAVSGVCAMQLGRFAGDALARGEAPALYVDFTPAMGVTPHALRGVRAADAPNENERAALDFLRARAAALDGVTGADFFTGLLPRRVAERLAGGDARALARRVSAYPLAVTGVKGFESAQVTAGGADPGEFDPQTLASRRVRGLYAAGEALDVDGDCGGFNLLFAFASGLLAGQAAGADA